MDPTDAYFLAFGMFGDGRLCLSDDSRIQVDQGDCCTGSGIHEDRTRSRCIKAGNSVRKIISI